MDTSDLHNVSAQAFVFTCVFYVLTQSINSLVISVLWSFSSDLFAGPHVVKYLSMFGAACTIGQGCGSLAATAILSAGGQVKLLLFLIALCLECAARCAISAAKQLGDVVVKPPKAADKNVQSVQMLRSMISDKYKRLICVYTICYSCTLALIYLERTSAVADSGVGLEEAAALSSKMNSTAAFLTLILQLGVSSYAAKYIGTTVGLFVVPIITAVGFSLSFVVDSPSSRLQVIVVVELARRVASFGIAKAVRESLYNVLGRKEKFVLKSMMDTLVYRGGMSLGGVVYEYRCFCEGVDNVFLGTGVMYLLIVLLFLLCAYELSCMWRDKQA
mmetsp:Transcript_5471/g.8468  ORF Transcript_5471/g.8468 Transcript_5471/m.8468 type:complete len:331 (-) Transcript_5471:321-1313(-)|eukprot:CAMPEP_0203761176 /NCGR_PEP_ID=MMETSP0098-20131031/14324_1 /ASSEMBLY_ACC=CAM_ASM_000208 /TAXON_ID=96639 /ORGANISM=" , Strain NY0313808BC1" /LENGTH=330 /DNA_ID=CAMNT_0050655059 /DNA_START=411 /DNA_END=1403 /DNA_ORIENTATION=-